MSVFINNNLNTMFLLLNLAELNNAPSFVDTSVVLILALDGPNPLMDLTMKPDFSGRINSSFTLSPK
nr:MAG TPA: hypothetical protein [Caudoviricetes sp.]